MKLLSLLFPPKLPNFTGPDCQTSVEYLTRMSRGAKVYHVKGGPMHAVTVSQAREKRVICLPGRTT